MNTIEQVYKRLINYQKITGYQIYNLKNQRVFDMDRSVAVNINCELFISGIPSDALEDELIPFFSTVGTIVRFKLFTYENNVRNRGFAVVSYLLPEYARKAYDRLSYMMFNNTFLTMEKMNNNCRLFIGGIPETKTKDEIWHELLRRGFDDIVDVIMYRSYKDKSLNRGYVFVEFVNHAVAAQTRMQYKEFYMWQCKVSVDWSEPIPTVDTDAMLRVSYNYIYFCMYILSLLINYNVHLRVHEMRRELCFFDVYVEETYTY